MALITRLIEPRGLELDRDIWFREEARAERSANLIRFIYLLIWLSATVPAMGLHTQWANLGNVGVGFVWLGFALLYQLFLWQKSYSPWQKYFSTAVDIGLNTILLYITQLGGDYQLALKSPVFLNYLMVFGIVALRFNRPLALFGAVLTITLYATLVWLVDMGNVIEYGTPLENFTTHKINFAYQIFRFLYLVTFTILILLLVGNTRRLVHMRVREEKEKIVEAEARKRNQATLERYFTPKLATWLRDNPSELGGQTREVTILISDVRGFTTLSESLGPEKSVQILNNMFAALVDIVFKFEGTLDKFLGDGMLVIFGAPNQDSDHAWHAVQAAAEMVQVMKTLEGVQHLKIGIGINTGEVIFGNIGSPKRMEFTVIGDTVNTTARLESLNKEFDSEILLTQSTLDAVGKKIEVKGVTEFQLRGKSARTKYFELVNVG